MGAPGLAWALLALLGVSWGSLGFPGAPCCGFGQGGWEGSFLIAICLQKCPETRFGDPGAFLGFILGVGPLAGTRNSQSRCDSVVFSAIHVPHAGFPTERKEGSARAPWGAPSQFVSF